MIICCEFTKTGQEHLIVNSCFLRIVSNIFSEETVQFWGQSEHYRRMDSEFTKDLLFKRIVVVSPKRGNMINWAIKFFFESFNVIILFFKILFFRPKCVFILSVSPFANFYISAFCKWIKLRTKIFICLHGELELVKFETGNKRVENLFARCLLKAFSIKSNSRFYIVYGEHIVSSVLKRELLSEAELIAIPHPYIFHPYEKYTVKKNDKIVFGHIGVAKLSKHSELFFKLAENFKMDVKSGRVSFVIIGEVLKDMQPFENDYVEYEAQNGLISSERYSSLCSAVDYAVFFYDDKSYELTGSGAIMDAISYNMNVIGIDCNLMRKTFKIEYELPVYLYNGFEEIAAASRRIIDKNKIHYSAYSEGFDSLKDKYSIDFVGRELERQLRELKII